MVKVETIQKCFSKCSFVINGLRGLKAQWDCYTRRRARSACS
jgi:hypothetical protein